MGKSYSNDQRERVVSFVEGGHSRQAAARHFDVSVSFVVKLMHRWEDTGSVAPRVQGRRPGGGRLSNCLDDVIDLVKAEPDITMPELAVAVEAWCGVTAHPASLSKLLCKAGYTYKKTADGKRVRTSRDP